MKQYHELCHFADDNGNVRGFALYNTDSKDGEFVTSDEFLGLVKDGKIQHFVSDDSDWGYKIEYTKEELKSMGSSRVLAKEYDNIENYFKNDSSVAYKYFDILRENEKVFLGLCSYPANLPLIGAVTPIILVTPYTAIFDFLNNPANDVRSFVREDPNFGTSYTICEKLLNQDAFKDMYKEIFKGFIFNTETLKRADATRAASKFRSKGVKISSLLKDTGVTAVSKVIALLDEITADTLDSLNVSDDDGDAKKMNLF